MFPIVNVFSAVIGGSGWILWIDESGYWMMTGSGETSSGFKFSLTGELDVDGDIKLSELFDGNTTWTTSQCEI